MDPVTDKLLSNLTRGLGLGDAGGLIISVITIVYIGLNMYYKTKNAKYYGIPNKYFEFTSFKELLAIIIVSLLVVFTLLYSFSTIFKDNTKLNLISFFFLYAGVVIMLYLSKYKFFNIDKSKGDSAEENEKETDIICETIFISSIFILIILCCICIPFNIYHFKRV